MMEEGDDDFFDAVDEEEPDSVTPSRQKSSGSLDPSKTGTSTPTDTSAATQPSSSPLLSSVNLATLKDLPPPTLMESLSGDVMKTSDGSVGVSDQGDISNNDNNNNSSGGASPPAPPNITAADTYVVETSGTATASPSPSPSPSPSTSPSSSASLSGAPDPTGSSNSQNPPPSPSASPDAKYKMVNADTGEVFDIRDLDNQMPQGKEGGYSLFADKQELLRQQSEGFHSDDDEDHSTTASSSDNKNDNKAHYKSKAKSMFKGFKRGVKSAVGSSTKSSSDSKIPNMIPTKCVKKDLAEFGDLLLVESVSSGHVGPVWVSKFDPSGKYLATGGQDKTVVIWDLCKPKKKSRGDSHAPANDSAAESNARSNDNNSSNSEDAEGDPMTSDPNAIGTSVKLLSNGPLRRFTSHTADVIDLSWSKTNFLLSASIDRTVRLWHVSRTECLHLFQHSDFVTAVDFHPLEDRYFLSGGFDKKLRIWCIPDGRVKEWAQAPAMITAAKFTPNGLMVVAGLYHGQVYFYSTEGMRYYTQIDARNRHGSQRAGKKVTGLAFLRGINTHRLESGSSSGNSSDGRERLSNSSSSSENSNRFNSNGSDSSSGSYGSRRTSSNGSIGSMSDRRSAIITEQLLVTTNDSRLRLFGLDDYSMVCKYKGFVNQAMQINATFSESGNHIISGSENGSVYIWSTEIKTQNSTFGSLTGGGKRDRNKSWECFTSTAATPPIVTTANFVSSKATKNAMLASGLLGFGRTVRHFEIVDHELGNAMIVSADYDGVLRVYLRKSALDAVVGAFEREEKEMRNSAQNNAYGEFGGEPFGLSTL